MSWGALKELKSKNDWNVKKPVEERKEEMIMVPKDNVPELYLCPVHTLTH